MTDYKTYIFDLYGTLLRHESDEKCASTWKKWLKYLDAIGIKHADYITFRREFFDMDLKARHKITREEGIKFPEIDVIPIYEELFNKYGNGVLDKDTLYRISFAFREASTSVMELYPGVEEYLAKLRRDGKRIFILSNAQRSYTEPEIKIFGLDKMVDDYLMSSDYHFMKPQAEFFDVLINKHDIDRESAVMIGDSKWSDIDGAINAGLQFIHLTGDNSADKFYIQALR